MALVFGFLISAVMQAWVPRERIERALSGGGLSPVARATGLGAASSSCSHAAIAIAKSLFQKGASARATEGSPRPGAPDVGASVRSPSEQVRSMRSRRATSVDAKSTSRFVECSVGRRRGRPAGDFVSERDLPTLVEVRGRVRRAGVDNCGAPRVSAFYGIVITMYWRDHPPPHFHAAYSGHVAAIAIETLEVIDGWLSARPEADRRMGG